MRILIVHSGNAVAGNSERYTFIYEQGKALGKMGVEVAYFAIVGKGAIGYLSNYSRLKKKIADFQPDIIHAHYGLCGLLANLQFRVPVVTTYHGSDINVPKILHFSKIAMILSSHNVFVSQRNMNIAFSFSPFTSRLKKRSTLLPCGVNLSDDQLTARDQARKILGIDENAIIILFAGAFDNAVKDAPLAQETIKQLLLKAESPFLKELRGYTRAEVNQWMCAANCLLMTSKTEGSPQVVKEALACGCPIVSVDVGDVAERIEGVKGCYVVSSRNSAEIAAALQKAIAFEGKTNGREHIIEMGISNRQIAEQLINIYTRYKHG